MIYRIYYEGKRKFALPVKNREELLSLRNSEENLSHLEAFQQGHQEEKGKLLQLAYNIGYANGALAGCKSIGSFFFHDVDCYDKEQSEVVKELILAKKEEIDLRMLERSASGGWHLVCQRKTGTTILENQVRVSTILQLEMDTSAKDLQRVAFSTSGSKEDLVYLDDSLFSEPMTEEECIQEYNKLKGRTMHRQEQVPPGAKKANKHYRPWEEEKMSDERSKMDDGKGMMADVAEKTEEVSQPSQIDGRIRFIAEGVMKEKQLEKGDFLNEGGRHTTVKIFLSGVTQLLKKEEVNAVLQELMPNHWQDDNIQQLVSDFYENYTNPSQRLLKYQEQLFTQSQRLDQKCTPEQTPLCSEPPKMPEKLPDLIALLTSNTPDVYKPTVAHAVFPPLGTHLCNVRFQYTDNKLHEATLMNCVMAGTGSGKGCIDDPIRYIMADIQRRDKENERREAEWKKDCQKRGANKDKLLRPEGLVIQMIDPDMTKPALVTRMDEAEGHFVYVKLNELDLFEQLKGQTGKQHFQLMCLAFDPDAEYGQTRIGTSSVTARPICRFNWNACTTILKGRRFFRKVLTDGPISRINFCTIPEQEIGAKQPVFGEYGLEFEEALKPFIDNLVNARGQIDCPEAYQLAQKLQDEVAEFSTLSQNWTYWNLSHRACVIAWLKACVLYVANGCKWEKAIDDFISWSLHYDLWCKMQFFGEEIAKAEAGEESHIGNRGPQNLLFFLNDEFTLEDAKRVRQQQGMDTSKTLKMIRNWMNRDYVTQNSEFSFKKTDKFKNKHKE